MCNAKSLAGNAGSQQRKPSFHHKSHSFLLIFEAIDFLIDRVHILLIACNVATTGAE